MDREDSKYVPRGTKKHREEKQAAFRETDWDDLRVFVVVAREGSLGRAAKALNITKPTIRRRIENLEASVGSPLFDRGKTGVVLTARGRQVAGMAEEMSTMIGNAIKRADREVVQGECKLAMSDGLANAWFVPNFLGPFIDRHPQVTLRLTATADSDKIAIPPLDIQVRYAPTHANDLNVVRVGTFHFSFFASRGYVERFGLPRSPEDLNNHRLAEVTLSSAGDAGVMSQYSKASPMGRQNFFTNSGHIVGKAVAADAVIGMLPTYSYLAESNFIPILPSFHYETGIFLYFSESASNKIATRAMIDFLRDVVFNKKDMPWFGDAYEPPEESWRNIFANLRRRAGGETAARYRILEEP
jgi:DNA-binding transcriptional LysR family regulator